jgi:4-amino-4-deoxy-L-arabinose transferase-like glycosyltransferase
MNPFHRWLKENWILLGVFFILLIQGSKLGLSDDEAYYWVLAQKPALGYAYHPPAVAWFIAAFQWLLGGWFGTATPGLVRLPAVLTTTIILGMALAWLRKLGLKPERSIRAVWVMLSFFGFFSLAWMIVPDIPLFLGWTILFTATWSLCMDKQSRAVQYVALWFGSMLIVLSKYSGILAVFSASISFLLWAPRDRKFKGTFALVLGLVAAALPIVIWNASHEWGSILYQIRDRHQGASASSFRYLKFWLVEMILAGPLLIFYFLQIVLRTFSIKTWRLALKGPGVGHQHELLIPYVALWTLPAAGVFCVQPLFSDFKLHWAFIVWWPTSIALAWHSQSASWKWIKYQVGYGILMGGVVLISCHIPLGNWLVQYYSKGTFDPRLDVTNDFYGWSHLREYMQSQWGDEIFKLPVVGSRYQTASQAAFSLNQKTEVSLIPRDIKERDEWPNLRVSQSQGPDWPVLNGPVLYVTDNRYQQPPSFPNASCKQMGRFEETRSQLIVKWIDVWRCIPK